MAFLDIIVPQYNEDDVTISILLGSIMQQEQIDFNDIEFLSLNK